MTGTIVPFQIKLNVRSQRSLSSYCLLVIDVEELLIVLMEVLVSMESVQQPKLKVIPASLTTTVLLRFIVMMECVRTLLPLDRHVIPLCLVPLEIFA